MRRRWIFVSVGARLAALPPVLVVGTARAAGYNVIRLARGAPFFSGGSVELDYLELT